MHIEERAKSSPENLPIFTNPLTSSTEALNDTFTFKDATSQPDRLDIVEETREQIGVNEIDKPWTLVRRR